MSSSKFEDQAESRGGVSPDEVRKSLLQQKAILDNIPDIAWLKDRESRFIAVNGPFGAACGVAPGELVGKTDHDIWPRDLAESYRADDAEVMRTRIRKRVEEQLVGPDGQERWIETIKTPIIDEHGDVIGTTGIARDITARRQAAEALQRSEERYRMLFEGNPNPLWVYDLETLAFLAVNEAALRKYGYSRDEFLSMTIADIRPEEDVPRLIDNIGKVSFGLDEAGVWRHRKKDGTVINVEIVSHTLLYEGRKAEIVLAHDITERKRAEEALQKSEERLTFILSNSPTVIYTCRPSGDFGATFISANVVDQMGYEVQEFISDPGFWSARIHPDDKQRVFAGLTGLFEKDSHAHEYRFRHGNGTWRWMYDEMKLIKDKAGNAVEILGSWTDITERKLAEQALALKNFVFDVSIAANSIADTNGVITQANQAFLKIWGYSGYDEAIGKKISDFLEHTDETTAIIKALNDTGKWEGTYTARKKDGTTFFAYSLATTLRDDQGILIGYQSSVLDITERRKADEALQQSEEQLRVIFNTSQAGIILVDSSGRITYANSRMAEMFRLPMEQLIGTSYPELLHASERAIGDSRMHQLIRGDIPSVSTERHYIRADGTDFWGYLSGQRLENPDGSLRALVGIIADISDSKKAEQERLELERRLLHSQKLESLGVLAGGIAHDFNNLLMAILGNLDLALMNITPGSPAIENIEQSAQATRRATDLTRQMLAYSGRGSFIVTAMDLNELVEENSRLFRAAISTTTILNLQLAEQLPQIRADAGQIQQVVMNLLTNASEAIGTQPGVIRLTTDVRDCDEDYLKQSRADEVPPPGRFVFLEVSDTGIGMDAETLQRLFDPFFTKKKAGRGLGMSAILGIVRGHRGAVLVESAPGRGTTIRILFPALMEAPPQREAAAKTAEERGAPAICGTVLVVDDETGVRSVCKDMIEYLGAAVLTASDGREAISVFQEHASCIDVVILDLSMPVMDGMTALPELLRIKPEVKVLLSSGFDREDALKGFSGEGLAGFIQKPYSLDKLRSALRSVLKPDA